MDKNIIEEKSEKSQSLEELHIFLRIIAVMLFLIGAYFLLTNPSINQSRNANHYRQYGLD